MKKLAFAAAVAALILFIPSAALYINDVGRLDRLCDISSRRTDIDSMNIHESSGFAGHRDVDTTVYCQLPNYFSLKPLIHPHLRSKTT